MNLARALAACGLFVSGSSFCAEAVTSTGANSPAIGSMSNSSVSYVSIDRSTKSVTTVQNFAATGKLNALQRHQDALLIAENPTKLQLAASDFRTWASDSEPYLTLTFRNPGRLPALNVEFGILVKTAKRLRLGSTLKPFFLTATPSSSVPKGAELNYGVPGGEEYVAPLIGMSELRKHLGLSPKFCIYAVGTLGQGVEPAPSPATPPDRGGFWHAAELSLRVAFSYASIFEQSYLTNGSVSVFVMQRDMDDRASLESGKPKRCLD